MNALNKKVQFKVRFTNSLNTVEPPSGSTKSAKTQSIMNSRMREGEHNSLFTGAQIVESGSLLKAQNRVDHDTVLPRADLTNLRN